MSKNKWFGTDGVRGTANVFPMTAEFALKLAMAAAEKVCFNYKKVAIAKDTRISGDMLEAALAAGFTAKGVDVVLLGILPTPAVTSFVDKLGVDMAVMITASHNPYQDNGIKLIAADGDKFADEMTAELENLIEKNAFELAFDKIGRVTRDTSIAEKYMQAACNMFEQKEQPLQGLSIVADCANGCFASILPQVLEKLGAEIICLGTAPDGQNINRACGSQHPQAMQEEVKKQKASLGIAVDGDGDRIKICDDKGNLIASEQLLAFLLKDAEQNGQNKKRPLASTKLANTALERYVSDVLGIAYLSTGVGERAVIKALKENGGKIGGEESGHIVLLDYAKSGDAMMTALALLKGIMAEGKKVSEIFPLFENDYLYFENFKVQSQAMVKEITSQEELKNLAAELNQKIAGQGRVVIHPSGTEPKIRIWVCGRNKAQVEEYGQLLWQKIEHLNCCD